MRIIHYIINPSSGKGRGIEIIPVIKSVMERHKIAYEISISPKANALTQLANNAVNSGATDIVAVGGDGTLREVMMGMLNSTCTLGLIPVGTGNDFAKCMGIPNEVETALEIIYEGHVRIIDVGSVNGTPYMNVMSFGIDSEIIERVGYFKKWLPGSAAYILSSILGIIKFNPITAKIDVNGVVDEIEVTLIAVGNGVYFGGGMAITPESNIEDGLLDVCIIHKMPKYKLLKFFPRLLKGQHIQLDEVSYLKTNCIKAVVNASSLKINLDGDLVTGNSVEVKIKDEKVNFVCPLSKK